MVAAALIDPAGRVLMHQRPRTKQHGGLWEFPGGKVEPGEAPAAALARELGEELGIAVWPAVFTFVASAADAGDALQIDLYLCRAWTGEPRCLEGEAIGWFSPAAILGLPMPPLDVPLAEALLAAI